MTVKFISKAKLPTKFAEFDLYGFLDESSNDEILVLGYNLENQNQNQNQNQNPMVRIHSECLTGDAFHSLKCDCGNQLDYAQQKIAQSAKGLIIYLRQEGRGIGILNKIKAYNLQDQGYDTVEANAKLGFGSDLRDYSACGAIFNYFGIKQISLMTNNPRKIKSLEKFVLVDRVSIHTEINKFNQDYIITKTNKLGHLFHK